MARIQTQYACIQAVFDAKPELSTSSPAMALSPSMPSPPSMTSSLLPTSQPTSTYLSYSRQNAAATVEWLERHYESRAGISLPRGAMFGHYLEHCRQVGLEPVNQASFGKLIRSVFPDVKTRRLGTRGQSKYHYYGMAIKESSPYRDIMMSAQRVNNCFGDPIGKNQYSRTVAQTSLNRTPTGLNDSLQGAVLLTDFPSASNISFTDNIKDTVAVFLMMYRHHCQRVIDTILRANLTDVKEFVTHFWQSLPNHIHRVLQDELVVGTVTLCDQVLYQAVTSLLIPGPLHPLPTNLMTAIRSFGRDLVLWLSDALKSHPSKLRLKKLEVARDLSEHLWRLTAVSHMAAVARSFLHSQDVRTKLPGDWRMLDPDVIIKELSHDLNMSADERSDIKQYVDEFGQLVQQRMTLEQFIHWIKVVFSQAIRKNLERSQGSSIQSASRVILLQWVYIAKIFIRELTLLSAEMFGPYHLMSLLSQDYILYLSEQWKRDENQHCLRQTILGGERTDFVPNWDKLNCVSPYINDSISSRYASPDFYLNTPEHAGISNVHIASYHHKLPESPLPQHIKREAPYSNLLSMQRLESCHFSSPDMLNQGRAFDQVEQTPPDEGKTGSAVGRALDLSLNYGSSFTEDDALVDKVISKGYATLDDCSPHTWKPSGSEQTTPRISSSMSHCESRLSRSPAVNQATSTITSPAQYHDLTSPSPSPVQQMSLGSHLRAGGEASHNLYPSSNNNNNNNNQNFNNSNNTRSNASSPQTLPSPAVSRMPQILSSTPSYISNYQSSSPQLYVSPAVNQYSNQRKDHHHHHHHHHQQQQQQQERAIYSPASQPTGQKLLFPSETPGTSRSPHSFQLPSDFTHISGSLQVAPLNPRKRWMLEENMRNGLMPSSLT